MREILQRKLQQKREKERLIIFKNKKHLTNKLILAPG